MARTTLQSKSTSEQIMEHGDEPPTPALSICCDGLRCMNVHWMFCFGTSMCSMIVGLLLYMLITISGPSIREPSSNNSLSGGWVFVQTCEIIAFIWTGIACCGCLLTYGRADPQHQNALQGCCPSVGSVAIGIHGCLGSDVGMDCCRDDGSRSGAMPTCDMSGFCPNDVRSCCSRITQLFTCRCRLQFD